MEHLIDLDSVGYGPIRLMWRYSTVADWNTVYGLLREKLLPGTQVFGFYGPEMECGICRCGVYGMILWPPPQQDKESTAGESPALTEWKNSLQEVRTALAELDELERWLCESYGEESLACLLEGHGESQWEVVPFGEGEDATQFVRDFVKNSEMYEPSLADDVDDGNVLFGEITVEYDARGRRWRETHSPTTDGGYVLSITPV